MNNAPILSQSGSDGGAARTIFVLPLREQWKTAAKQRAISLFCRSPHRQRPRISAENAMSSADNLWQKQQNSGNYPVQAAILCTLECD
jgi:hypothetical protein